MEHRAAPGALPRPGHPGPVAPHRFWPLAPRGVSPGPAQAHGPLSQPPWLGRIRHLLRLMRLPRANSPSSPPSPDPVGLASGDRAASRSLIRPVWDGATPVWSYFRCRTLRSSRAAELRVLESGCRAAQSRAAVSYNLGAARIYLSAPPETNSALVVKRRRQLCFRAIRKATLGSVV